MNPLEMSLIIIGGIILYVAIGTFFGMFLYRHDFPDDEVGAFFCGALWPVALPIVLAIAIGILIFKIIDRKKGWQAK